ncbi:MAG: hypothetical protein AAB938_00515 [Patescibacteria group bacterium]
MDASINRLKEKIKRIAGVVGDPDIFTAGMIVLVALLSFGLGRLSARESARSPIAITQSPAAALIARETNSASGVPNKSATGLDAKGNYVASKNGTKYYLPWCSGATRIKEENKVWFTSVEEAKKSGYEPAQTCKGL